MKKIEKIKKGLFSRNTSLVKYAVKTGASIIKHRDDPKKMFESIVGVDPDKFVNELSHYKGSITKAGQLISQYGEYYLPKEVNEKLKKLQSHTHFLGFDKLKSQISPEIQSKLEFEETPLAAASIGQVHLAKLKDKKSDETYAVKIQYNGIEKAISGDLFFLKLFLNSIKVVPKGVDLGDIFEEIEKVLRLEMNYVREGEILDKYSSLLNDEYFHVPKFYKEYSDSKVLCLEYIDGLSLNKVCDTKHPQDKINYLGEKIFELFLREIYEFQIVQTDAHGGNYFVKEDLSKVYLLDFGACLEYNNDDLNYYKNFLIESAKQDKEEFFKYFDGFAEYSNKPLEYDKDLMWQYIQLISSPLRASEYDWGATKLPDELFALGKELRKTMTFKSVPSQFIFIDRKMIGVFTLLRKLKATFDVKSVFERVALKDQ